MDSLGHTEEFELVKLKRSPSWPTSCAMFIAIILLIATFFWVFIRLEPLLDDVVDQSNASPVVTPTIILTSQP